MNQLPHKTSRDWNLMPIKTIFFPLGSKTLGGCRGRLLAATGMICRSCRRLPIIVGSSPRSNLRLKADVVVFV